MTAFVIKFIEHLRRMTTEQSIVSTPYREPRELRKTQTLWFKENQCFRVQFNPCSIESSIKYTRRWRRKFKVVWTNENAYVIMPIVIARNHYLANVLVYYSHLKVQYNGVKQTITETPSYWIIRIRSFVRKVLFPCLYVKG